ncbi:MAG: hypothetical protein GYA14_09125 [Ignavibacteria bacterium]|nr:hypothetical protein [Ignavibacteria bacterium]
MKTQNENGSKATIREVIDLLKPLQEDISNTKIDIREIKTLLMEHLKNYDKHCDESKVEISSIKDVLSRKISTKAFISWLSAVSIIIGIIISLLTTFHII